MILTTPRCQIRSFSEAYIQSALPLFTDKQVRAFLGGPMPADWAEKRLERWATVKSDSQYFVVTLLDGTFIGFIDISPYHEPEYQELSYLFLPEFWGYGYAFEACQAVLQYAQLVNSMLEKALVRLSPDEHPIIHSERGCHYRWPGWIKRVNRCRTD